MRWMWIMMGLLAGAAALTLLGAWSRKVRRTSKGEVSLMAAVKRVSLPGEAGPAVCFVSRGQELSFAVPREIARQLRPGQRGVLTFSGREFVYFVPKEELFPQEEGGLPQVS